MPASVCIMGLSAPAPDKVLAFLIGAPVAALMWYGVWVIFARPLRQRNRANCLLGALRFGRGRGLSVESVLQSMAEGRLIRHRGIRRAARAVSAGGDVEQAFHGLGTAVPLQVRGFLAAGTRLGDLNRVLPLAERVVARQRSRTEAFSHYLFLILFYWGILFFVSLSQIIILPKYRRIFDNMFGLENNPLSDSGALQAAGVFGYILTAITVLLVLVAASYILDRRCIAHRLRLPLDFLVQAVLPWRRKRSRRDFGLMLAACLEAGLQESEAVKLAAASTGDEWLKHQARRAGFLLSEGDSLPDVCALLFDRTGELAWRLRTSQTGDKGPGALDAIEGWCRYLEAGAYRDEQAAAQLGSTIMLLGAAVFVGLMAYALLHPLAQLVEGMSLW